jgi:hypothetical protein
MVVLAGFLHHKGKKIIIQTSAQSLVLRYGTTDLIKEFYFSFIFLWVVLGGRTQGLGPARQVCFSHSDSLVKEF